MNSAAQAGTTQGDPDMVTTRIAAASPTAAPGTENPAAVRLSGLRKSYGTVRAVDGVDLSIAQGSMVAVLGRNGAGKSTLLSLLLGLLPPDAGEARLFGRAPEQAIREGLVGAMPQDGGLIARVTVRELVGFVAGAYPRPLPLAEVLRLAQLTDLAGRRVDKLSGGQAQRVRFALAIAGDPRLLVLDEPTAALDVDARRQLWTVIGDWAAQGKTVLFTTHYLEEADRYADRIVIVAAGRVAADGRGDQLKRQAGAADLDGAFVAFAGGR
jgi:ABC-2 type transport system ATP-binding protein